MHIITALMHINKFSFVKLIIIRIIVQFHPWLQVANCFYSPSYSSLLLGGCQSRNSVHLQRIAGDGFLLIGPIMGYKNNN